MNKKALWVVRIGDYSMVYHADITTTMGEVEDRESKCVELAHKKLKEWGDVVHG